ncbi:MAG: glycoside hydrolase family 43 protein [Pirellulales bacterium]
MNKRVTRFGILPAVLTLIIVSSLAAQTSPPQGERGARAGERRGEQGGGQRRGGRPRGPQPFRTGLSLRDFRAHDPFIVPFQPDKTYYLYNSGRIDEGHGGVVVYKSKDLKTWEGPRPVFTIPDGIWANPGENPWAPEVHEYKGKYYLFTTLHNRNTVLGQPPEVWRFNQARGSVIARADSPNGPFELLKTDGPVPPKDYMTLDGTFYVDPAGQPWMVYCHEWQQIIDGTFEAVKLSPDLSQPIGDPIFLFKASDGPWFANTEQPTSRDMRSYVSDGCELYRTKDGHLLMLWSSHSKWSYRDIGGYGGYVQAVARSKTGKLEGPWEQLGVIVGDDSGHGMLFRTFEGQLMLVLHQPFGAGAHANLFDMADEGDHFRVLRPRADLDGREPLK